MKKRRMMLVTTMMLAVLLIAGGTLAWFTATAEPVVNEFTAGTLEINLVDDFEGATNVNPGDCYFKEVYVENLGTKRAFVRVEKEMAFDNANLDLDVVIYHLGEGWVEHDGYFYYTEELAAYVEGEDAPRTSDLFEFMPCEENGVQPAFFWPKARCPICKIWYYKHKGHKCPDPTDPDPDDPDPVDPPCGGHICFDGPSMDNTYQGAVFTITVSAEAIQVTNGAALDEWEVDPLNLP